MGYKTLIPIWRKEHLKLLSHLKETTDGNCEYGPKAKALLLLGHPRWSVQPKETIKLSENRGQNPMFIEKTR